MSKTYYAPETPIVFSDGGDVQWSVDGTPDGAGQHSDFHDRGAGSKAAIAEIKLVTRYASAPTVRQALYVSIVGGGNAATPDSETGITADAAVTDRELLARAFAVPNVVTEASAGVEMVAIFTVEIAHRHFAMAAWNDSGAALGGTAGNTKSEITFIPPEAQ